MKAESAHTYTYYSMKYSIYYRQRKHTLTHNIVRFECVYVRGHHSLCWMPTGSESIFSLLCDLTGIRMEMLALNYAHNSSSNMKFDQANIILFHHSQQYNRQQQQQRTSQLCPHASPGIVLLFCPPSQLAPLSFFFSHFSAVSISSESVRVSKFENTHSLTHTHQQ